MLTTGNDKKFSVDVLKSNQGIDEGIMTEIGEEVDFDLEDFEADETAIQFYDNTDESTEFAEDFEFDEDSVPYEETDEFVEDGDLEDFEPDEEEGFEE